MKNPEYDAFEAWRQAVRLAKGFPRLATLEHPLPRADSSGRELPTEDSRRLFLEGDLAQDAESVYRSLGASRAVLTAPGHGATTLARWAYFRARHDAIVRRAIPVLLSIEDLIVGSSYADLADAEEAFLEDNHPSLQRLKFIDVDDEDAVEEFQETADDAANAIFRHITASYCRDAIATRVHFEVVRALATQEWEEATSRTTYRDLLGLSEANPDLFAETRAQLQAHYERMPIGFVPPADELESFWTTLRPHAPNLAKGDYLSLLGSLSDYGVRVLLILDLSATPMGRQYLGDPRDEGGGGEYLTEPYKNVLRHMAQALKNMQQSGEQLRDATYVMSSAAWPVFTAGWKALEAERLLVTPYRPLDLFAVLAYHYPPDRNEQTGRRTELLAAVLDSDYLHLTPSTAISTEMVLLKATIRNSLAERGRIPYQQRYRYENSLQWAREVWGLYGHRDEKATDFLHSVLSEEVLGRIRSDRLDER